MRAIILGVLAVLGALAIGACATFFVVVCRWDGLCGAPGQRSAAWIRTEARGGMPVPQLVKLAESAPFDTWWTVSLKDCTALPTHSFYMQADGNGHGYVGVTVKGSFDRSEQRFRTRDDLFAAMPSHLRCRRVEISYPHWGVPMALSASGHVDQIFNPQWHD